MTKSIDVKDFVRNQRKIPILQQNLSYLSPKEYAAHIKSHPVTVFKWLQAGKIEGALKIEGRWKIPLQNA